MNELARFLLAGLGGAAVVLGAFSFIVRYLLKRVIDHYFGKAFVISDARVALMRDGAALLRRKDFAVYPEIATLVYRAKLGVQKVAAAKDILGLADPDVIDSCRELSTRLEDYRIYLQPDVFRLLHEYKHLLQDVLVVTDTYLRPGTLTSSGSAKGIPHEARARLSELADQIVRQHDIIEPKMREHLVAYSGNLLEEERRRPASGSKTAV